MFVFAKPNRRLTFKLLSCELFDQPHRSKLYAEFFDLNYHMMFTIDAFLISEHVGD
jgi:hypothetical protein